MKPKRGIVQSEVFPFFFLFYNRFEEIEDVYFMDDFGSLRKLNIHVGHVFLFSDESIMTR